MDFSNFVEDAAVINKDTFVSIEEDLDTDSEKAEAYRLVILSYLTDNTVLSEDKHINTIVRMCRAGQIGTMQRYKKAKAKGSEGGKTVKIDRNEVFRLRDQGYTQNQIGESLGCSDRQVRNILSEGKSGNEKAEMKAEVPEAEISGNEPEISHAEIDAEQEISGNNLKTKTNTKIEIKKETKLPIEKNGTECSEGFSDSSFSSSNSHNEADVVELLIEICGYDNQKHIYNTLSGLPFSDVG